MGRSICNDNALSWPICIVLVTGFSCITDGSTRSKTPLAPAIIVFGDSTVDAGNNNYLPTIVKSDFPPYGRDFDTRKATGRFCNGRLATDYIALLVGLPYPLAYLDPEAKGENIVQGICFASSASGYYNGTADNFNVASLTGQLKWYQEYFGKLSEIVGPANASSIISKALFILSTGSNDYVNNYYINLDLQNKYHLDQYRDILLSSYKSFIQELYNSGARRIAVISLPPLGCLPSQITLYGEGEVKCIEFLNTQALSFNQDLRQATTTLKNSMPDIRLAYSDIYTVFLDVISEPRKYGFSHALKSCCGVGNLEIIFHPDRIDPRWWYVIQLNARKRRVFEEKDIVELDTHDEPPPNFGDVLEEPEPLIQTPNDVEMMGEEGTNGNDETPTIVQDQIGGNLRPPRLEIELEEEENEYEGSSHHQRDTIENLRLYLDLDSDEY